MTKSIISHRCDGSLAAKASIRYEKKFDVTPPKWYLKIYGLNIDWMRVGLKSVTEIKYCPFCGEKLEEPTKKVKSVLDDAKEFGGGFIKGLTTPHPLAKEPKAIAGDQDRVKMAGAYIDAINTISVQLDRGAFMPTRAHDADAGYDIRTPYEFDVNAMDHITVYTGVHIAIPKGYVGMLKAKSGLNINYSILGEGVIDAGYTGQIVAKLYNHGVIPVHFARGDKIIQLVLLPIFTPDLQQVDDLPPTERGADGFGSTGR